MGTRQWPARADAARGDRHRLMRRLDHEAPVPEAPLTAHDAGPTTGLVISIDLSEAGPR